MTMRRRVLNRKILTMRDPDIMLAMNGQRNTREPVKPALLPSMKGVTSMTAKRMHTISVSPSGDETTIRRTRRRINHTAIYMPAGIYDLCVRRELVLLETVS